MRYLTTSRNAHPAVAPAHMIKGDVLFHRGSKSVKRVARDASFRGFDTVVILTNAGGTVTRKTLHVTRSGSRFSWTRASAPAIPHKNGR